MHKFKNCVFSSHIEQLKVVREGHEIKGLSKQADEEGEDFFIGGQDSCLGDSGGPLWKVLGSPTRRAFLVGVVSRGLNCANNDAPGIYARVKMYLGWIYANAREGECPNLERQRKRKMREEKEEEEESDEDEDSSSAGESIEFSDEIGDDDDEEEETSSILEERRLRLNLLLKENGGGGGDERTNNAQGVLDLLKKRREKESKKEVVRKHIDKIIETVAPDYGGGDYTEKKSGGGGGGKAGEDMGGGTHIISRETLRASPAKGGMGGGGEGRPHRLHRQKVSKDSQERARLRRGEQEGGGSGDDLADYLDEDVGGKNHRKSRRRRHVAKARYDGMKAKKEGGSRLKAPSAKKRGRKSF